MEHPEPQAGTTKRARCHVRDTMRVRVREAEVEMWHEQVDRRRAELAEGKPPSPGPGSGPARKRYLYLLDEYLRHIQKHGC